jgi:ribosomal protein L6P/L9E
MSVVGKKETKRLVVSAYFASRRELACLRTVTTHVKNMITGVTKVITIITSTLGS